MEIRNVGGINPVPQPPRKPTKISSLPSGNNDDSLKVSDEARLMEDETFIKNVLAKTPDIDREKIETIKKRLANGDYNNKSVIDTLTENLMKALGL